MKVDFVSTFVMTAVPHVVCSVHRVLQYPDDYPQLLTLSETKIRKLQSFLKKSVAKLPPHFSDFHGHPDNTIECTPTEARVLANLMRAARETFLADEDTYDTYACMSIDTAERVLRTQLQFTPPPAPSTPPPSPFSELTPGLVQRTASFMTAKDLAATVRAHPRIQFSLAEGVCRDTVVAELRACQKGFCVFSRTNRHAAPFSQIWLRVFSLPGFQRLKWKNAIQTVEFDFGKMQFQPPIPQLPDSVTLVKLVSLDRAISWGWLPRFLKHLELDARTHNACQLAPGDLPETLESFTLNWVGGPIQEGVLPPSLKRLEILVMGVTTTRISRMRFPQGLEALLLGDGCEFMILSERLFPRSLKCLAFSRFFSYSQLESIVPPTVEFLALERKQWMDVPRWFCPAADIDLPNIIRHWVQTHEVYRRCQQPRGTAHQTRKINLPV